MTQYSFVGLSNDASVRIINQRYITVTTRLTDRGSVLTVEDSGAGFNPGDENEPHIAPANLTERLKMMCSGSLTIEAREGGGTRVTVVIPPKQPAPDTEKARETGKP